MNDILALIIMLACVLIPCIATIVMLIGGSSVILAVGQWVKKKEEERFDTRYKRK